MTEMQDRGMLALAWVVLTFGLLPEDLENAAHQLAEFDAINDHYTEKQNVTRD